jgi:ADP-heptose:LPS heptosyltransferase
VTFIKIRSHRRKFSNSDSVEQKIDVNVLETSLESISDLFKEYDAVQFKIEKLQLKKKKDADEAQLAEESDKERGEVETQYRAIVSKIKSLLRKNKSSAWDSINIKAPIVHGQESLDCIN